MEPEANNGEFIYYKNIAKNVLRQSKIEETKKNQEDNFTMEFNFQPHFLKTEGSENYSNVKSRFYRESIPITKYLDENTTFQPNKNSKKIELKGEEDIKKMANRLYSEQKKFKENREKLSKNLIKGECPFKPTINVPGKADPKYFMMRLEKWNKKIEEKNKENIEKKNNLGAGPGKSKLFQPVVKDPIAKKIKRENDVHTDLYNKGLEHLDYRKSLMETDKREDLKQIEIAKKERIKNLKEERDRFKKEKKEKMEKEINERTLKAKEEKEKLEKIINERTDQILKEKEKENEKKELDFQKKKNIIKKEAENVENKNINKENKKLKQKKDNISNLNKNENDKKEKKQIKEKPKKEEIKKTKISSKEKEKENKKEKKPVSSKQKTDSKAPKTANDKGQKIAKETKLSKKNNKEELPIKKLEKKERNRSQPPKSKNKANEIKKEKESKTITISKEDKENSKTSNKNENNYAKKLKNAKNNNIKNLLYNKNEIIGELEFNSLKKNQKPSTSHSNANEYNVISIGSKAEKIKKEKKVKK